MKARKTFLDELEKRNKRMQRAIDRVESAGVDDKWVTEHGHLTRHRVHRVVVECRLEFRVSDHSPATLPTMDAGTR